MVVVRDSSVPGRVARFLPAWRKCMTRAIRPASTIGFIGLSETNTIGYYNFCLPHTSLRLPLPPPEVTHGTGAAKRWQPRTPAMAAGLTDHVWTLRGVLLFRVPPWPQPAGV